MSYSVALNKRALKELGSLPRQIQEQIAARLRSMQEEPLRNSEKLHGREGYRVRSGDYRILFDIDHKTASVTVFAIGHRREIYR